MDYLTGVFLTQLCQKSFSWHLIIEFYTHTKAISLLRESSLNKKLSNVDLKLQHMWKNIFQSKSLSANAGFDFPTPSSLGHGLVYTSSHFNFKMGNSSLKNTRESSRRACSCKRKRGARAGMNECAEWGGKTPSRLIQGTN